MKNPFQFKYEFSSRVDEALGHLAHCTLCPRRCGVDRTADQTGTCGIGAMARVASFGPHYGEEAPLVGTDRARGGGSGTIFFAGCNLLCSFCQNSDISHSAAGNECDANQLADIMIQLQYQGCHNINLVTPTHVVPQILAALPAAIESGLRLPLVYNSGGYDSVETLRLLDGVIDIYMPDFKFWHGEGAQWLSGVTDYAEVASAALQEMHRQVGDLVIERGVARSGLLVRHLVMPRQATDSRAILAFLRSLSSETYVNVMSQYRPCSVARTDRTIGTPLSPSEYVQALDWARDAGLTRLDNG